MDKTPFWLAKETKIGYDNLKKLANGDTNSIKFENLETICKVLNVDIKDILIIEDAYGTRYSTSLLDTEEKASKEDNYKTMKETRETNINYGMEKYDKSSVKEDDELNTEMLINKILNNKKFNETIKKALNSSINEEKAKHK